jgi:hypothetical protein
VAILGLCTIILEVCCSQYVSFSIQPTFLKLVAHMRLWGLELAMQVVTKYDHDVILQML